MPVIFAADGSLNEQFPSFAKARSRVINLASNLIDGSAKARFELRESLQPRFIPLSGKQATCDPSGAPDLSSASCMPDTTAHLQFGPFACTLDRAPP